MKVRLRDLAESLGLSVMAVSKALRDAPDIGVATKAKVRAEADRRGYWPNEAARSLRVKQSGWVGMILPDLTSEEGAVLSGGLAEAAQESGIAVLVGLARTAKEEAEQVRAMMGRGAEAIFLLPRISTEHRSTALEIANRMGFPLLFLKRYPADVGLGSGRVSWVVRDMKGAADLVLDHLYDLGHRRVAYVGGALGGEESRFALASRAGGSGETGDESLGWCDDGRTGLGGCRARNEKNTREKGAADRGDLWDRWVGQRGDPGVWTTRGFGSELRQCDRSGGWRFCPARSSAINDRAVPEFGKIRF